MRLDYKILWFENQPSGVKSASESLEFDIESLGFKLSIDWVDDYSNIDQLINTYAKNKNFDMIFMDWNLGISPDDGATLSHKLRTHKIQTDIIFYSAKSSRELRQLMFDNNVDGVFCINRSHLAEESFEIIENKIQRILDINHMRGIVMETVGTFDHHLNNLIETIYIKSEEDKKNDIIKKIKKLILEQGSDSANTIELLFEQENPNLKDILTTYHFSSYLKFRCLTSILKHKRKDPIFNQPLSILSSYDSNVITPRNALAHAISEIDDSGKLVLVTPKKIYDPDELCKVRKNLLLHRSNLLSLNNTLTHMDKI